MTDDDACCRFVDFAKIEATTQTQGGRDEKATSIWLGED